MLKIVHMTTVHTADDIRIRRKECATLAEAGFDVVLLAPADENHNCWGVKVLGLGRERGRLHRMTSGLVRALIAAMRERAKLYHFHDPELIAVGMVLKVLGKRVVYDVHEDVPQSILHKPWIPSALRPTVSWAVALVEKLAARWFDGIVAATPSIGRKFRRERTVVVQNFPIVGELEAGDSQPMARRSTRIVYVGCITRERGIVPLVDAMDLLPEASGARLVLAGTMDAELERELRGKPGWKWVDYLGWRDRKEIGELLANARAGVVTFLPVPNHTEAQPNKLFEYMSVGLPVIASDFPLWREMVGNLNCGLLVDPDSPQAIARAIERLLDHPKEAERMGSRGKAAVRGNLNWENEAGRLLELYQRLLAGATPNIARLNGVPAPSLDEASRAA